MFFPIWLCSFTTFTSSFYISTCELPDVYLCFFFSFTCIICFSSNEFLVFWSRTSDTTLSLECLKFSCHFHFYDSLPSVELVAIYTSIISVLHILLMPVLRLSAKIKILVVADISLAHKVNR